MGRARFGAKRSDVLWLDPEDVTIALDKESPFYDPRAEWAVDEKLVENIMLNMQGVLEPIIIAKDGEDPVCVDGRQRLKALLEVNDRLTVEGIEPLKIPCLYKIGSSQKLLAMSVSVNVHCKAETPIHMAQKLEVYLNNGGTVKDACVLFGVTETTIRRWEKLSCLDEDITDQVEQGKITVNDALEIADKPRAEQKPAAKKTKKTKASKKKSRKQGPRTKAELMAEINSTDRSPDFKDAIRWVLRIGNV